MIVFGHEIVGGVYAARIGDSDCETLAVDDVFAQPVNAITSLAYVGVGIAIAVAIVARRLRSGRIESIVYAVCLAAIGVGSVAFHGPQPAGSRLMHDLPILVTAMFMVLHDLGLLVRRFPPLLPTLAVATAIVLGVSLASADAGVALTGVALIALIVVEVVIYRRRLRRSSERVQRAFYGAIVGVALFAGLSWVLGRTDSPVCEPDSILQAHGLWHLLSATLFGLWWLLAYSTTSDGEPVSDPRAEHVDHR